MKFVVEGKMRMGERIESFVKEIEAASRKRAEELVLQKLGADHKLKRSQIKIEKVEEWKNEQSG
ncbi:MAG: 50S ribosomal protein L18Ae [Candidatus Micrarchaeota archaeon]